MPPPLLAVASLEAPGGLQGALSAHAEDVFGKLSAGEQVLAETLFRCITLREGTGPDARSTRRPQRLDQIAAVAECGWRNLEPVVRSFAAEGVNFLHHGEPLGPESVIDISHEALIRQWERLRTWADDEAERAAELRRWRDRAVLRQQGGELLAGADLARAVEWRDNEAGRRPKPQWAARYLDSDGEIGFAETLAFIAESEAAETERREREKRQELRILEARAEADRARAEATARELDQAQAHARRSRRLSLVALATAVLALISAGVALAYYLKAKESAKESLVRQLANEATFRSDLESDRAQLLAVAAFETAGLPVSEVAVRQAYSQSEGLLRTFRGHEGMVNSAVFSPDGRHRAHRQWGQRRRGCGTRPPASPSHTLRGHEDLVCSAAFSPDGRTVAHRQCRQDGAAVGRGHRPDPRHPPRTRELRSAARRSARTGGRCSPPARTARRGCGTRPPARPSQTLRGHEREVNSAAFSPDGRPSSPPVDDKTARLWDAATGQTLANRPRSTQRGVYSRGVQPRRPTVLTGSDDKTARLWDAATGQARPRPQRARARGLPVGVQPGRPAVLTGSWDKTARLWDAATGQAAPQPSTAHEDWVLSAVAFSPDGRTVLTGSEDKTARLWDAATGQPLRPLRWSTQGSVHSVAFSPDGQTVLTGSSDTTARLWDAATGRPVVPPCSGTTRSVFGRGVQPGRPTRPDRPARTGRRGCGTRPPASPGASPLGHAGAVVTVARSARTAERVLTGSWDKTARLWDAATGQPVSPPLRARGPVVQRGVQPRRANRPHRQ